MSLVISPKLPGCQKRSCPGRTIVPFESLQDSSFEKSSLAMDDLASTFSFGGHPFIKMRFLYTE